MIDAFRAQAYRVAAPWLGEWLADRARRVRALAYFSIFSSLLLTLVSPLWLLALGPVLLGVPHLVADARYLVAQPGLHRHGWWSAAAAGPLVALALGAPTVVGLLPMLPLIWLARGSVARTAVALAAWVTLTGLALAFEFSFVLVLLHVHNLVALAFWWAWQPRARATWGVPVAVVAAVALLLSGAADGVLTFLGAWAAPGSGASFSEFVATHAPGLPPMLAARLVLSFAFLQSLHYAVWLRLIPDDARRRQVPRPFHDTWVALRRDFGLPLLLAFCALALGVAVWGAFDLPGARLGYLSLASFHGYLELAVAAYFLVQGKRPVPC